MKKKFALLAAVILFLLGIWLVQWAVTLSPCQYPSWLVWLPGQVEAQSPNPDGCPLCPDCSAACAPPPHGWTSTVMCSFYYICSESTCRNTCLNRPDKPDKHEEPPQPPPDDVDPAGRQDAYDPYTANEACAACFLRIRFDVPAAAVSKPVEVRAYHTGLPAGVPAPKKGIIGCPFFFGAWINGEGKTVAKFDEPIAIKVSDDRTAISAYQKGMGIPAPAENPLSPQGTNGADGQPAGIASQGNQVPPNEATGSDGKPAGIASQGNQVPPQLPPNEATGSDVKPAGTAPAENQVHLSMYDPATKAWVKLCSRGDGQTVSAALVLPTPLEEGGNALFALTMDDTPALDQSADQQGKTTLSIPGSNFRFGILPGTVEVGTYFETTYLSNVPSGGSLRLLPTPVDIKACQADYTTANQIRQVTRFSKPLEITFGFDAETLTRAGGKGNLTMAGLNDGQWADLEELNSRLVRGDSTITVDSSSLGAFGLAVR